MRGRDEEQEVMLAHVDINGRVLKDHPLRTIKKVADAALERLSPEFDRMYLVVRPPIAECVRRATLGITPRLHIDLTHSRVS